MNWRRTGTPGDRGASNLMEVLGGSRAVPVWPICGLVLLLLGGCGGGGGGGGTTPSGQTGRALGKVMQLSTGQPVSGATVWFGQSQGTTDTQGQYAVEAIPVGTTQYQVEAPGFTTAAGTLATAIAAGDNTVPDVLLQLGVSDTAPGVPFSIQGRVTLSGQSNAAGVTVAALDPATQDVLDQTQTGTDGRYTLWVPPGTVRLRAARTGFVTQQRDVNVADINQPVTADFQLSP
jgi:Carboxypeptidase regulatory-like domain